MPMGPIELADMVGLDIGWAVGQELAKPGSPIPKKLQALVEAKNFGMKTGRASTLGEGQAAEVLHRPGHRRPARRSPIAWWPRR
jgi:3-hydroxyacyl-CoA dehydrogenase